MGGRLGAGYVSRMYTYAAEQIVDGFFQSLVSAARVPFQPGLDTPETTKAEAQHPPIHALDRSRFMSWCVQSFMRSM